MEHESLAIDAAPAVIELPLTQGYVALIDAELFAQVLSCEFKTGDVWTGRICDLSWSATVLTTHTKYARWTWRRNRELRLHRVVVEARAGQVVDHRDGNGLDCRRFNLRVTDLHGNAHNRRRDRGLAHEYKGVTSRWGRWQAQIRIHGRKTHIGSFLTIEDAARAYDRAALEHFGEFARLNFPAPQPVAAAG